MFGSVSPWMCAQLTVQWFRPWDVCCLSFSECSWEHCFLSRVKMSEPFTEREKNTLQSLRCVGVCAQGFAGLISNASVAFSLPINTPPQVRILLSLALVFLRLFPPDMLFFVLCSEFWVTHFHQVTDNKPWTSATSLTVRGITVMVAMTSISLWRPGIKFIFPFSWLRLHFPSFVRELTFIISCFCISCLLLFCIMYFSANIVLSSGWL